VRIAFLATNYKGKEGRKGFFSHNTAIRNSIA